MTRLGRAIAFSVPLLIGGAAGAAYLKYRAGIAEAERAAAAVLDRAGALPAVFDLAMVADQPEIARRYFAHAIAPGTPLASVVALEMRGTFLLGDLQDHQPYRMTARQVLRPPFEFVWMPVLKSGLMTITGSDALVDERAWTRFWLAGLVPVANEQTSSDMLRSAQFRAATEGVWLPTSLLPQRGVRWQQESSDQALVTFANVQPAIELRLTIADNGAVREFVGQRWSNANPGRSFRLQPFGGKVLDEARFGGFTIPSRLHVGNHYGTPDYLPFFQAEVVDARYR